MGDEGAVDDWLGVPMYFGSHDAPTNRRLLEKAGFVLLIDDVVTMSEPEGQATFHWVIAKKPDPEGVTHSARRRRLDAIVRAGEEAGIYEATATPRRTR